MSTVIKVEHLSKLYTIAHQRRSNKVSLHIALERKIRSLASIFLPRNKVNLNSEIEHGAETEDFYALNDISFEVGVGERVGIIGANGAGKSTLLKILSRITEPTEGRIIINGRVSSLLEVGTGFHPELTGRENIFLNGAILGMPRTEIRKKFDEIVAFSEVERFLDTPVKHYSSGMYVRLAFSVSAHLDPEVLILDEVLAVGDARFQKKCMNQMRRFSEEGRTVLFVSHSASAINQFCSTAIFLEGGRIKEMGPAQEVVESYMLQSMQSIDTSTETLVPKFVPNQPSGDKFVEIESVEVSAVGEAASDGRVSIGHAIEIILVFRVRTESEHVFVPNFHIRTIDGLYVAVVFPSNSVVGKLAVGVYSAVCIVSPNFFNNGVFTVQVAISSFNLGQTVHANISNALVFEVVDDLSDLSHRNGYMQAYPGVVRPRWEWRIGDQA